MIYSKIEAVKLKNRLEKLLANQILNVSDFVDGKPVLVTPNQKLKNINIGSYRCDDSYYLQLRYCDIGSANMNPHFIGLLGHVSFVKMGVEIQSFDSDDRKIKKLIEY